MNAVAERGGAEAELSVAWEETRPRFLGMRL